MDALTQKKINEAKEHISNAEKRFFILINNNDLEKANLV